MNRIIFSECLIASFLRFWLSTSDYKQIISDRVEISTPLNSWKRVTEGSVLYEEGIDPYLGDAFHETPFILILFHWLIQNLSSTSICIIFIACDVMTALLLYKTASLFMKELNDLQEANKSQYASNIEKLLITKDDVIMSPIYVISAFLFNPYIILSCVAQTTTVLANFLLASVFYSMTARRSILCYICLSLAVLQSIYPITLLAPICLYFQKPGKLIRSFLVPIFSVTLLSSLFLYFFAQSIGSWSFLNSVYGFILTVPDLRPNVGLFWYFFTEMFEHFRSLFLCAFQINATFLYVIPLSLRLYKEPMLLAASLTALSAVFKSYPSVGDVGFYLSLLPMWKHLFHYMQQGFFVQCFFIGTSVFGPTVWHLWIYSRSANANFFFGVTLAFATTQIFLITDILFAFIKREFAVTHGVNRVINGKEAKLVLN